MRRRNRILATAAAFLATAVLAGCVEGPPDASTDAVAVAEAFAESGIAILDDVADAWPEDALLASPISAIDVMQAEIDSRGGLSGADLEEFAPMPDGAPSFSYLVAAWLSQVSTPRAWLARGWMPEEVDWTRARSVWFPRAVILMFVADAMEASIVDFAAADDANPESRGPALAHVAQVVDRVPQVALPQAPCSAVANFFAETIDRVFSAVQLPPDFIATGGTLGAISGFLAGLFNTAVQLAKSVVVTVINTLTAPIMQAISTAVAIVGVLSQVSTYVLGISMRIVSSEQPVILDGREGYWYGLVEAQRPLEAQLQDCLSTLGLQPMRDIVKAGAPITWRPDPPLRADGGSFDRAALVYLGLATNVESGGRLVLKWVAAVEEASNEPEQLGTARITADVPKGAVSELFDFAKKLLDDAIDSIAQRGGILAPSIKSALQGLMSEIFRRIEAEVLGVGRSLLMIIGSGETRFVYHDPEGPAPTPSASDPACYVGTWRFESVVSSRWLSRNIAFNRFDLTIDASGLYAVRTLGWNIDFDGVTRITAAELTPDGWRTTAAPMTPARANPADNAVQIPVVAYGAAPSLISCSPDGRTLTIVGLAEPTYGPTTWRFRRE